MTWREPPAGWSTFGTHIDHPGPLEFSAELDEDGLPFWERLRPPEIVDCACGRDHERMPMIDISFGDDEAPHYVEGVCRIHKRHIPCRRCDDAWKDVR